MKPYIKEFDDYHDIEFYVTDINDHFNSTSLKQYKPLKGYELDLENYGYYYDTNYIGAQTYFGLFYKDIRPTKAQIRKMLAKYLKGNYLWLNTLK